MNLLHSVTYININDVKSKDAAHIIYSMTQLQQYKFFKKKGGKPIYQSPVTFLSFFIGLLD